MDVKSYEGTSEEVECVRVPGVGHEACGPERLDEQLDEAAGGDRGPGPVLARESAERGGPPRARPGEPGNGRREPGEATT